MIQDSLRESDLYKKDIQILRSELVSIGHV